jgi:hypothetical protein
MDIVAHMTEVTPNSGSTEAIILIKAAPQVGQRSGETVCCAGLDRYGNWLRLYPVSFRHLDRGQKFGRWDRIRFKWRLPKDDQRPESRRVDQDSIEIIGKLKKREQEPFLANAIVTSLNRERENGRSLALLKAEVIEFSIEKKSLSELAEEAQRFAAIRNQGDLFSKQVISYGVCPYRFKYRYRTEDGERFGTCQDWELEATYFKWSKLYGEHQTILKIQSVFGEEYPRKGMLLAMGTHSQYPDTWLINGVMRLNDVKQATLF